MEPKKNLKSGTTVSMKESLKKATTEMMVLSLLRGKPMYTYEMMSSIEQLSKGVITFNTLYQSIYRLQDFGYIREHSKLLSEDNRVRIYFAITDIGATYLNKLLEEYLLFTNTLDCILGLKRKEMREWTSSVI